MVCNKQRGKQFKILDMKQLWSAVLLLIVVSEDQGAQHVLQGLHAHTHTLLE